MAIAPVSAASATSSNWLKEAQQSIIASQSPGGLLGTLQDATAANPGSIKTYLAKSQNSLNSLALIAQNSQQSAGALAAQMSATANQKLRDERILLAQKMNPQQTNYSKPAGLDPVVFFGDGMSLNTISNIMTMSNGTQIDTTTGLQYHDPKSIISMANGAYLDTKYNILTMSDGTRIDTISGLIITA